MAEPTVTFQPEQGRAEPPGSDGTPPSPRTLGPYELVVWLGRGGMADVWIAVRHGGFGFRQHFAVKTMRTELGASAAFRAMFLEEARFASQVHHTNVVPVLDLGEDHGTVYQAMPLVDGDSVASLLKRLREAGKDDALPLDIALRIAIDAARGLHAAHMARDENGRHLELVHRDVSPQNILVGLDGVAKVSDFGIAKAFGLATEETSSNDVKGKRAYLAPEQIKRQAIDRRADIFALGVVLWEMLAGARLFATGDSAMYLSLVGKVQDVRDLRAAVPEGVARAIARALAAEAGDRFASAEELADELEKAAREGGIAPSAKSVGQLVETLVGRDVHGRSRVLSEWTAARSAGPTGTLGTADTTSDTAVVETLLHAKARPRRRAPLVAIAIAIATVLAVVVAGAVFARRPRAVQGAAAAPPSAAAAAVDLSASSAPTASSLAPPAPPASGAAAPSEGDRASAIAAPAPSAKPQPPAPRQAPRGRPAPQPKFSDNPYAH